MAFATMLGLHQHFPTLRISWFIHIPEEVKKGKKVSHFRLIHFLGRIFFGCHLSPHLWPMVPHQGGELRLADIRFWKGAEIRSLLASFAPDGMAGTALLRSENFPSCFDIPREEVLSFLFGPNCLFQRNDIASKKEDTNKE